MLTRHNQVLGSPTGGTGRAKPLRVLAALSIGASGLSLLVAPGAHAALPDNCSAAGAVVTCTFEATGAAQTWTAPAGVTQATFDIYGAAGGKVSQSAGSFAASGGLGGRTQATLTVTAGIAYQVNVGGAGESRIFTPSNVTGGVGGFNGGAAGGQGPFFGGGGGGGASDIRSGAFALADRLLVAGGGGGGGGFVGGNGGAGGGLVGTDGNPFANGGYGGLGAGASAGGLGGLGGLPASVDSYDPTLAYGGNGAVGVGGAGGAFDEPGIDGGGGGGGGLFGGGGGGFGYYGGGGGGGSGYGPSGVVLTAGVREGSGLVTISYTQPGSPPAFSAAPSNITVNADSGACSATVAAPSYTVTGTPAPTVSFASAMPGTFPVGSTSVTATAANGITPNATATFNVTVVDAQNPTFTSSVAGPLVVDATSPSGATVSYATATASDNCPGVTVARTAGFASGATFPIGDTTVTYVATDAAGRTTSTSAVVRVRSGLNQLTALQTAVAGIAPGSALTSKLATVNAALVAGDKTAACSGLRDFIALANAQKGKKLTSAQVSAFTSSATRIRNALGC